MQVIKIIKKDLHRYCGKNTFRCFFRYFCLTAGYLYSVFFRLTIHSKFRLTYFIWKFLLRQCMLRTCIQIPDHTKIDEGLRILYFGHIVINPFAITGKNFNIAQGCLVGNSAGKKKGAPIIGDNACMQSGSVVGKVLIGNNVLFAPNSFCNFDVPNDSIVLGNPGIIIQKENPTKDYIGFPI